MKKIIAIITILSCLSPAARGQYTDEIKDLIENERFGSAETLLEQRIDDHPDPETNYLLVKTYLEQDKTNEARLFVDQRLQPLLQSDADPLTRIAAARYHLNAGNNQEAQRIFTSVLSNKKNQKNATLLLAMADAVISEENGDARQALTWLEQAGKRDRTNAAIDIEKGLAYRKLNDASNAFLWYQSALKKNPSSVRAHYLMGKIFRAQKNPEVYMQHYLEAYKLDSTYAPVLEELYNHYYSRDVKNARKFLEKYIANTDHSLANDYAMTDMYYLTGDYKQAIQGAEQLITIQQQKSQPRLYKLIAYSYANEKDSVKALSYIKTYFEKEIPSKIIAPDYRFIAQLTDKKPGQEDAAIAYYTIAVEMDTLSAHKSEYAAAVADLYKRKEDYGKQAAWLGKAYQWKEKGNNIDLFNWGLAYYMAKDYPMTDSVFAIYTSRYPADIYGYYWRAQANAAIDTTMSDSLAIPYYRKVVETGEQDTESNKKMLVKAYGYLGAYEANVGKHYSVALEWFLKYQELDKENGDIAKYIGILRKWVMEGKNK